jgi:ubiquinone/menaquinone biosynthesis C-methylase UbiE
MTGSERAYYDHRAAEYDDFYTGGGLFAARDRPGWHEELERLKTILAALPERTTLDVACGTGFLTRSLPGPVTAIDQSRSMLAIARERLPGGAIVQGDALRLPFRAGSFGRIAAGHFYGHLAEPARFQFLAEARRVAEEILIVDAAFRPGVEPRQNQERILNDGSRHTVFKRYFTGGELESELGPLSVLHAGRWFVAVGCQFGAG